MVYSVRFKLLTANSRLLKLRGMNNNNFENAVHTLLQDAPERNLEAYLLALYQLLPKQDGTCTAEQILQLLSQAFTASFSIYQGQWAHIAVPNDEIIWLKFTNPDVTSNLEKPVLANDLAFTQQVLQFQIHELHSMRGKQLEDKYRFFGIDSDAGHRWYNFTPQDNISCGLAGVLDNLADDDSPISFTWGFIGLLFEMGRIYE